MKTTTLGAAEDIARARQITRNRTISECAEACDVLADAEDVAAITGPTALVASHRERESAFREAANRLRKMFED